MNVNEPVWVKVTTEGWAVHDKHWTDTLGDYFTDHPIPRGENRDQWQKFQLWDLMNTFGPGMQLGFGALFKNNEIKFKKPRTA